MPKFADQPEFIRRFEAEAQTVARLEHPHIVPLYDFWREPAAAYLIMRLLLGGSDLRYDVPGVDNSLRLWEVETGEQIQILEGHADGVLYAEISPDGRKAVSTALDNTVRLWNLESGEEIQRLDYHSTPRDFAFHPEGGRVLISTDDPSLIIWDLESGEILDNFIGHEATSNAVAFSPDGRTALSGASNSSYILWDIESGQQIRRFASDPRSAGFNIVFSPDGRLTVSQAVNRSVAVWDTETWEIVRVFRKNEGFTNINMLNIGPDGRTVVSADSEGNALVWDLVSDEIIHSFSSHKQLPVYPAISPDGRFLLLGSQDHSVILWDLKTPTLDELREWIQSNCYVRELSCSDRALFLIEPLCEEEVVETTAVHMPQPAGFEGTEGEVLTIRLVADDPAGDLPEEEQAKLEDTVLFVIVPDGSLLEWNDDDPSEETFSNSLIEGLVIPVDGTYEIQARAYKDRSAGPYTLIIEVAEEEM